MKLIYLIFFISLNVICSKLIATTIVVVNIQSLIEGNINFINKIKEIEINQEQYVENFRNKENELSQILDDIENSKLILSENEINSQIDDYNAKLNKFSNLVNEFNNHYQNQLISIREQVLKEIIKILEKYAIENDIDLILDSTSYLIASNSIDITDFINNELKNKKFELEYKDFEKN